MISEIEMANQLSITGIKTARPCGASFAPQGSLTIQVSCRFPSPTRRSLSWTMAPEFVSNPRRPPPGGGKNIWHRQS